MIPSPAVRRPRAAAFLAALVLLAAPAAAQEKAALARKLDSLAAGAVRQGQAVGLVAAVVQGSDTLLFRAYGQADVEWNVPMASDAMFETGSIAKQFTAAAILQLRDAGKLSLDDDITRWLPDFNTRGHRVPLRRLLDHTSGIHDLTETPEFPALVSNRVFPRDSSYALIQRYPFDFAPGEAQLYSNSGFILLGLIVEKASGMSYDEYLAKKIFEPLGMTRSMGCNSYANVARRAHGYGLENGTVRRAPTNVAQWAMGAGSVCSTAGDLVRWLQGLHGGKVLSPASYAEMTAPSSLANGMKLRYGMGLGVEKGVRPVDAIWHGGIIAGFRSQAAWFPQTRTAVVVLTNTVGGIDPEDLAWELAEAVLSPPSRTIRPFTGNAAPLLGRYTGRPSTRDITVEVTQGPQGLMVSSNGSPPRPLDWVEGSTFMINDIILIFGRPDASGKVTELGFNPAKGVLGVLRRQ